MIINGAVTVPVTDIFTCPRANETVKECDWLQRAKASQFFPLMSGQEKESSVFFTPKESFTVILFITLKLLFIRLTMKIPQNN